MSHCSNCAGTKVDGPWGNGGRIKRVPATRSNYRAKNDAGGRKCVMTQTPGYAKDFQGRVASWHGYGRRLEALELRAELVAKIAESAQSGGSEPA